MVFMHNLNLKGFVNAPINNYYESAGNVLYKKYALNDLLQHVLILLAGSVVLFLTHRFIIKYEKESDQHLAESISNLAKSEANEERFRIIFNNAPSGMATIDRKGNFLSISDSFLAIVDHTREEMLHKRFHDITYGEDAKISESFLAKLDEGAQECRYEKRYVRSDGSIIWVRVSASGLRDSSGKVDQYIVAVDDIQKEKNMEDQMILAKKMESIGILAGGIAHDFNNCLTVMLGNTEMIKVVFDDKKKVFAHLEKVESAANAAIGVVKQLQTFAKGGSPRKKNADINAVIVQAAELVLHGKAFTPRWKLDQELPLIEFDPGQISQVITNLIINAVQAMPEGGNLTIGSTWQKFEAINDFSLKDGYYVEVSITDSGIGMNKRQMEQIFDPYFTTKETGTGLGLAAVHSIIKKHNGCIHVDSLENTGTKFTFYLPMSNKIKMITIDEKKQELIGNPQSLRIIIMDDEKEVCFVISAMLTSLGHRTICVSNGESMLMQYEQAMEINEPYDICIMDLNVKGGMGGQEAVKHLLKLDPNAKAIVCSGYNDKDVMANFKDHGFSGRIEKPPTTNGLASVVAKVFSGNL